MIARNEMTINGDDIQQYNARLFNYSIGGTERSYSQSSYGSILRLPDIYHTVVSPRSLSITLTFFPKAYGTDSSRNCSIQEKLSRSTDNIVRFESDISNRALEICLPDGYIYKALLKSCGTPTFDATGQQDVEYSFLAIRTKAKITVTTSSGGSINCKSNTITPFKMSFTAPSALNSITVCGIVIRSINAGALIEIDSELGLITADGNNKFNDSELIDFPYLIPGNNTIDCSVSDLEIRVTYTPIYE